jgi:hypothetical protein
VLSGLAVPTVVACSLLGINRKPRITLELDVDVLRLRHGPWDTLYTMTRRLEIPVAHIAGVAAAPRDQVPATGMRLPGTSLPGVIRAGAYGIRPNRDLWNVRRAKTVLVIQLLPGAAYRRLVLEVPDPTAEAARLRPALGAYTEPFR